MVVSELVMIFCGGLFFRGVAGHVTEFYTESRAYTTRYSNVYNSLYNILWMHFYNRNAIHNSLKLLRSPAKLIPKHRPLQSLIPRIILKQSLVHNLFKNLGHHKPILLGQRKEPLRLGQQPRLVWSEDHQRDRLRLALESHLHSLDQTPMLAVAIHYIRHDECIKRRITRW